MNIAVVGLSHKTAPVEIREKLSIQDAELESAIAQLRSYPHIEEVVILSTCNRLEIYIVASETEQGVFEIARFLSEKSASSIPQLRQHLFILLHQDASRHIMRVAAGLDSLVIGEGQILSQVKHTHKLAQKYKGLGRILDRLFKQAITAGKRVRSETSIGSGAMSISSAAVELAQMKVQNFAGYCVAVIGAGKMAQLLVQHLLAKGAEKISIVNRSSKRAEELASKFPEAEIELYPLSEMMSAITASDLAFTSTAASEPILDRSKLEMSLEPNRALMLFDISVPRNVHADVNELAHVETYNVDDLKAVVAQNSESRRRIAQEAETLLEEEMLAFEIWWRSLEAVPTISSLREKVEGIREQELEKALSRLGSEFADKHQEVIEALTRGIVNKILHEPMVELRSQQDMETRRRTLESLRSLFNLDKGKQLS
ncbi:MAG: glutamyl-tRNA reductase [Cyanobacteria bacterium QS_7_48_42]|jgi:glutamyl-tRNA reductase|nr:MAG: glutamyl-tRNA reductase [Cyanobacteria bacterium QS_1_48_34]PSO69668.1 MAG: glutamyl-tRNA reductase [Cyanobacteria bacterium QH_3_48_40]PSO76510.1 MAG: glutamyl-tRNA reductase [Cyanobacteria bacterium QS_4_48_99]PSO79915.1 MAG: glutamyl-tRNA reductase [Cyanobacteria bacterium QS_5_48_63]PSO86366.1 MAG: glutamyl-tRNA reductase [Cyanobacteria bacterium QH_9_48_43]PSO90355.1 MAG: glutamyl-tRNA reductase [Cyanobacteria bacterium QS_3_48_167]PSO90770.1 MAG: glutamyl-tRNA reductase [Cyanoba